MAAWTLGIVIVEFVALTLTTGVKPAGPVQTFVNGMPAGTLLLAVKLTVEPGQTFVGGDIEQVGSAAMKTVTCGDASTLFRHWLFMSGNNEVPLVYSNWNCKEPAVLSAAVIV